MAVVSSDPFKEHATVMDALKASYSGPEDVSMVEEVGRIEKEMTELFGERILNMEAAIRRLTTKVEDARTDVSDRPEREGVHEKRVSELQDAMNLSRENIEKLSKENRFLQQQCRKLVTEAAALEQRRHDLEQFSSKTDPRVRSLVSLYVHITNTYWDECSTSSHWKGIHSCDGAMKRIDIDRAEATEFDAINEVWDEIGV
eukprot:jgi/Botrbrau1/9913/Bobra.0012s0014.1